jgi:hypothetical protein
LVLVVRVEQQSRLILPVEMTVLMVLSHLLDHGYSLVLAAVEGVVDRGVPIAAVVVDL